MRPSPVFFLWLLLPLSASSASVITVDYLNGSGDFTEIQPAIDSAEDGDTVIVLPGEYVIGESITFRGKAITVKGASSPERTTIRITPREIENPDVGTKSDPRLATLEDKSLLRSVPNTCDLPPKRGGAPWGASCRQAGSEPAKCDAERPKTVPATAQASARPHREGLSSSSRKSYPILCLFWP